MRVESSSAAAAPPHKLTEEGGAQMYEGVTLILSRWSALQLAVDNGFAGRDSHNLPRQLSDDIFSFFTLSKEPLYIDDLEDRIDEFMLTYNTEIDDGSIEEIAEKLMIMHEECLEGNYHSVQRLRDNPIPRAVQHIRQVGDSDDDDDDDSDEEDESSVMTVDSPKFRSGIANSNEEMMVDKPSSNVQAEDGWTVVAPKRNRGRKN